MNFRTFFAIHPGLFRCVRWLLLLALTVGPVVTARAQIDVFLRFIPTNNSPVIAGDSTDARFPGNAGWTAVTGFSLGAINPTTIGSATGGGGAGRISFLDFALEKPVNVGSPNIFRALATGGHQHMAELAIRRAGGSGSQAFLTYEFKTVFFTSQNWVGANGGDVPMESVRMIYGSFRITYRPQNPDGSLGSPVVGTWNQVLNTATF